VTRWSFENGRRAREGNSTVEAASTRLETMTESSIQHVLHRGHAHQSLLLQRGVVKVWVFESTVRP
jgi:tRNA splicing ligase